MAGLSNFITNSATQSTTMPTWYDQAQQNVVNQATTGAANVPTLANTVAGGAINELNNPATNPFTQAQGTLNQISSGAANPWITDAATGAVTPNTSTAMGGLFAAQNQELNQLLPNYVAPVTGANIASGNFGSLRGETALNKAKADAFAQLLPAQMQAALQNQQTGATAASGLGQVGSQGVTAMTNLGQAQQSDPLLAASALGKIIGGINAPTTTTNQTQLSPLNQIGSIASALGGSISGTNKLLGELFPAQGSPTLPNGQPNPNYKPAGSLSTLGSAIANKVFGGGGGSGGSGWAGSGLDQTLAAGTYTLADGSTMQITSDGYRTINFPDGTSKTFDQDGNLLNTGRNDQYADTDTDLGGGGDTNTDTGGSTDTGGNTDTSTDNTDYTDTTYDPYVPDYNPPEYDSNPAPDWSNDLSFD